MHFQPALPRARLEVTISPVHFKLIQILVERGTTQVISVLIPPFQTNHHRPNYIKRNPCDKRDDTGAVPMTERRAKWEENRYSSTESEEDFE